MSTRADLESRDRREGDSKKRLEEVKRVVEICEKDESGKKMVGGSKQEKDRAQKRESNSSERVDRGCLEVHDSGTGDGLVGSDRVTSSGDDEVCLQESEREGVFVRLRCKVARRGSEQREEEEKKRTDETLESLGNVDGLSSLVDLDVLGSAVGDEGTVVVTVVVGLLGKLERRLVSRARGLGDDRQGGERLETRGEGSSGTAG